MSEIGDQRDRIAALEDEITRLRLAVRRLAEQDATLSVCDGNVTVTMDATLTDAEREAIDAAAHAAAQLYAGPDGVALAATLRGPLERLGGERWHLDTRKN